MLTMPQRWLHRESLKEDLDLLLLISTLMLYQERERQMLTTTLLRTAAARCIRSTFLTKYSDIRRNMRSCYGLGATILVAQKGFGVTMIPRGRPGKYFRDSGRDGAIFISGSGTIAGLKMTMAGFQHMLSTTSRTLSATILRGQALRFSPRLKLTRHALKTGGTADKEIGNVSDTTAWNSIAETNSLTILMR